MDHATVAPNGVMAFRFLTDEWPGHDRIQAIRNHYDRTIMRRTFLPHAFEPIGSGPTQLDMACHTLPDLRLAYVTCANLRVLRTRDLLVDDHLALNVTLSGSRTALHCGREITVGEGEAVLATGAETCDAMFRESQFISLRVSAKAIAASVRNLDDHIARPIGRDNEALKLLTRYASALRDANATATPEMRRLSATHMHDLIALALGATPDAADLAKERGARAARLSAIKSDIAENAADEALTVTAVAARHRLPVRYLQRLFEEDGSSFTAYLLEQRLARAHRTLINPRLSNLKVSAIALDAGFGNLSYFNQSFRRRYGASPSDIRAAARLMN